MDSHFDSLLMTFKVVPRLPYLSIKPLDNIVKKKNNNN